MRRSGIGRQVQVHITQWQAKVVGRNCSEQGSMRCAAEMSGRNHNQDQPRQEWNWHGRQAVAGQAQYTNTGTRE